MLDRRSQAAVRRLARVLEGEPAEGDLTGNQWFGYMAGSQQGKCVTVPLSWAV